MFKTFLDAINSFSWYCQQNAFLQNCLFGYALPYPMFYWKWKCSKWAKGTHYTIWYWRFVIPKKELCKKTRIIRRSKSSNSGLRSKVELWGLLQHQNCFKIGSEVFRNHSGLISNSIHTTLWKIMNNLYKSYFLLWIPRFYPLKGAYLQNKKPISLAGMMPLQQYFGSPSGGSAQSAPGSQSYDTVSTNAVSTNTTPSQRDRNHSPTCSLLDWLRKIFK